MIRAFVKSDLNQVMKIWLETNLSAHDFVPAHFWKEHYEAVSYALPQAEVYVYEQDGIVYGFVGLTDDYIAGIFVDGTVQSQGIGTQLLRYVKALRLRLTLQVYAKNERAVRFYQNEGFAIREEGIDEDTGEREYFMEYIA